MICQDTCVKILKPLYANILYVHTYSNMFICIMYVYTYIPYKGKSWQKKILAKLENCELFAENFLANIY